MLWYIMEQFPRDTPVICSECITMISEYRVYVVNGEIKGICQYIKPKEDQKDIPLDVDVVKKAVKTFYESEEGQDLKGCGIDFAVIKKGEGEEEKYYTCLIEVNDGYALGHYEGVSGKDYTDMLIARWMALLKKSYIHFIYYFKHFQVKFGIEEIKDCNKFIFILF